MRISNRKPGFFPLTIIFCFFIVFLYGPTLTIAILSFQGPDGGLTFPLNGLSLHWFRALFEKQQVGDFGGSLMRSLLLGFAVMICTVLFSLLAGLAYRRAFKGSTVLFYLTLVSLILPSILISLGIGIMFDRLGLSPHWYSSAFGAHLTWSLPFGLLIMFAVFNRFNKAYEAAAVDMGATAWQTFRLVVLPLILPSLIGVGLFGFTLSYDEFARTIMTAGSFNTLPLEIYGMTTNVTTPVLYALGTFTTVFSFILIVLTLVIITAIKRRQKKPLPSSEAHV
jgi:putative spermidine/putrescine transport system permease protein